MGEKKRRQYSREQLLKVNPWCCYCGAVAVTTDHCPPRALFYGRKWPEGYEFPACNSCNQEAKRDEQIVSVVAKIWAFKEMTEDQTKYWQRMVRGIRNNRPDVMAEWNNRSSRNEQKHALREIYGKQRGDDLRRLGYGVADLGDLTHEAITRFGVKLCKALFYKHCETILDGQVWVLNTSLATGHINQKALDLMTSIAPFVSDAQRQAVNLQDQFIYKYNYKPGPTAVLFAVVQFSDQLIYNVVGFSNDFLEDVKEQMAAIPQNIFPFIRVNAARQFWPR